ncbi:MAG: PriCT-2 domain-containing protein [Aliivibrio sp.]|uniref:PriCT-2 domain-containing protein n=1 Tax=Aliivibrio sp. TaxID=1872443 RepID=UPI001A494095|nr:PriCT-2 domain-containing protein [Aliivibrio sp.]
MNEQPQSNTYLNAACKALIFGFKPIPLKPKTKITSCKWDTWLEELSENTISIYWEKEPDHELGIIVGDNMIVYDADTPESLVKLYEIEKIFDIHSNHTVKTKKGEHHYFYRPDGVTAKSNSHSTEQHPDRLDVKTGRALIVRPPSTDKEMNIDEAESVNGFTRVTQEFVDAIDLHNGINRHSKLTNTVTAPKKSFTSNETKILEDLLAYISPDCSYDEWVQIGMALHHELAGSDDGLVLWDEWSSKGIDYCGYEKIKYKYQSFDGHKGVKITMATIVSRAEQNGADVLKIQSQFDEDFEVCETYEVVHKKAVTPNIQSKKSTVAINPLAKHSLLGKSAEYESNISEEQFIIGKIALAGQITVIYAQYNTGKTLIVLALLIEAINSQIIQAKNVFYINADDNHRGLVAKMTLADEFGFNMLAPGHNGFEVKNFTTALIEMAKNGTAKGAIVVVDTLKKFTDLMDKRKSSEFGQIARQFVSKGGTIISLGHVNKRKNAEDKAVHAGTSDIMDDADCAYILDTVSEENNIKTVLFENTKSRGCVASKAAYQYAIEDDISYNELISTVTYIDDIKATQIFSEEKCSAEAPCIKAIIAKIDQGVNTKMKLAESVSKEIGQSKRKVINTIEKHTGDDPKTHKWSFKVAARGAKIYEVLHLSPPKTPPSTAP